MENVNKIDTALPDAEPQLLFSGSYIRLEHVLYVSFFYLTS